ncbi:MAG: hypothetical protein K1V80_03150 [Muribaculaceae bacterium]|uniref:hypothetical protein n=1 Tax=uncultured Muribaculum sp. TaxID=1918613 RepID=UPI0026EC3D0B|nr:hypothetical protein [uncultured Muribaculum sp.]
MNEKQTSTATVIILIVAVATFLAFLVLKLCGLLAWSWWWITAPAWIPVLLVLLALGFLGLCLMILSYVAKRRIK